MPRRKPASERQNRETRDIGVLQLKRHDGPPPAPKVGGKAMLVVTVERWNTFWQSDVAGAVTDADWPALQRLFEDYDMRERLLRAYMRKPFEKGSTGQIVVHPAAREIASLDKRIEALENDFGKTPAARLALGIALGAAAKSLEQMNHEFDSDDGPVDDYDVDPRQQPGVIDVSAAG